MEEIIVLKKPIIYSSKKYIINCIDSLICSFINSHGYPHYWLFSDLGFYYYSHEDFRIDEKYLESLVEKNLKDLYKVNMIEYENVDLAEKITETIVRKKMPLFLLIDVFNVPWSPFYQKVHHVHFIAVTNINILKKEVFVYDLRPKGYADWYSFDELEIAFKLGGQQCFKLSPPNFNHNIEILKYKLESCYQKIIGEKNLVFSSGIFGYEKFLEDIKAMDNDCINYIELWWELLQKVIYNREHFLEFILYLNLDNDSILYGKLDKEFILNVEETNNMFYSFRNSIMKSSMKGNFNIEANIKKLSKIIESEKKNANYIKDLITKIY
ncbi:TPA: hypothetical protein QCX34_004417 [Bacillus anthracis]|nr:hypothetical protein [Bacillus anthracis]